MVLSALQRELERNMEIASKTRQLIRDERDMLQVKVEKRLALHRFHTDVWDSIINGGELQQLEEATSDIASCYMELKEINELVDKFDAHGSPKLYAPLLQQAAQGYSRDELIDVIQQRCGAVTDRIREASTALSGVMDRQCPVCGERFESATGMKSHIAQKTDEEHENYAIDL